MTGNYLLRQEVLCRNKAWVGTGAVGSRPNIFFFFLSQQGPGQIGWFWVAT